MSKLATCCISIWLALGSLAGLLLGQYQSNSLHPVVIPFLLLLVVALVIVIVTLVLVAQRLVRGEGHRNAVVWFTV